MRIPSLARAGLLATGLALVVTPPASAEAKLRLGIYDCYGYNYATGFSDYKGSVRFNGGGRYEHTFGRTKQRFEDKTSGRYRVRGKRIVFKGGAMQHTPGRIADVEPGDAPTFAVWVDGEASGVTCTYVEKP